MFTRCPSCRAAFSITQQQLEIAAGMVRCGMCEHVFDAKLYLFNQSIDDHSRDESELIDQEVQKIDIELSSDSTSSLQDTNAIDLEVLDRELHENPSQQSSEVTDIVNDNLETGVHNDLQQEVEEKNQAHVPKIIADQISNLEQEPGKINPIQWLGLVLIAMLIGLLGLQATAAVKADLLPSAYRQDVCKWLKCTLEIPRALNKIDVLNRSIFTHPTESEALMVTLTIINRAEFAQPYPIIQLRFLNISGNVIAARRFSANHYLPGKWNKENLMATKTPLSIQLEVHDVGEEVVSYDFEFL